jgi:hypothetical protein
MLLAVGPQWIAPDDHATYAEVISQLSFPRNDRSVHPHSDRVYCKRISGKNHPLSLSRRRRSNIPAVLRWRLGSAPRRTPALPASGHTSPTALATRPARCCAAPLGLDRRRACERVGPSGATRQEGLGKGGLGNAGAGGNFNSWVMAAMRQTVRRQTSSIAPQVRWR